MSDSDDDYTEYGTALEPVDEDSIPRKKPFSLEDQVVKDAQGRRRFHGAFTGGFSAGFFNTVGSLEGWTPSSFKSSRSERMGNKVQRPADFMDDEDIGEFGIAPQVLRATDDFNHLKRSRGKLFADGPIPGEPVLKLLLEPVRETVGLRILRRMGWRPGQGVGPRVAPRVRKRIVGCAPPPSESSAVAASSSSGSSSEEDEVAAAGGITFAPGDVPAFLVQPKTDKFGLGYQGLDRRPVLSSSGDGKAAQRRVVLGGGRGGTVSVAGQAFGVGALEEEDEDIYSLEDMSQYDFELGGPATSRHKAKQPSAAQGGNTLEDMFSKALYVSVREHFPPPPLPKDFTPVLKPRKTRFDQPPQGTPSSALAPSSRPRCADERAALLEGGADRETGGGDEETRERERLRAEALKLTASLAPAGPSVGAGAGGRFTPFAGHPEKQRRYEQFLALRRAGQSEKLTHLQPLNMTEWERQREKTEFEQAARLFQPLSADMGERFVSASQSDDSTNPMVPVEKSLGATPEQRSAAKMKMFGRMTRTEEAWQPCDLVCKRFNIAKPTVSNVPANTQNRKKFSVFDYLNAAQHNVIQTEKPAQTIASSSSKTADQDVLPNDSLHCKSLMKLPDSVSLDSSVVKETSHSVSSTIPEKILIEGDKEPKSELAAEQANDIQQPNETKARVEDYSFSEPSEKIDLFKAIFLSSSESDSDDEDKNEESGLSMVDSQKDKVQHPELSHLVASAPATVQTGLTEILKRPINKPAAKSGVFANLDLDTLISTPSNSESSAAATTKSENKETKSGSVSLSQVTDDDVYGPRLPASHISNSNSRGRSLTSVVTTPRVTSPVCEWVESSTLNKKKKKKKEKKHKDKKNKSSKHKKHKHSKK